MKKESNMQHTIYRCINRILKRENKEYAKLNEIYEEIATYLEVENTKALQSQIRGRLQDYCKQYTSFKGEELFITEKVRSGKWKTKTDKNEKTHKYIRYTEYKFLVSHDNWKSFELTDTITEKTVREENVDQIYRVKLMHEIGKEKSSIILEELDRIRHLLKEKKSEKILQEQEGYGLAFEVFAILALHNIDAEKCIQDFIIHGSTDGGIDAIYYDEGNDIYVYQIKMDHLPDNAYDHMKVSYDECCRGIIPKNGKDLNDFMKKKRDLLKNKRPNFRSVSKTSKKKTNYQPSEIYEMFFRNKLLPLEQNNLTLSILKPKSPDSEESICYNVSKDNNNNFIFYMYAEEIIKYLLEPLGITEKNYDETSIDISKYFSDNVRGVLTVNKKMVETIKTEPENFVKYNNGISITGEVLDLENKIVIHNPIINNGQQSITTLIKTKENLERINLPIKITNECDKVIKGKISQFSNDQVKVKAIDMLSINSYVRDLQREIFEKASKTESYFLEIYSSGKKSYDGMLRKLYKKNHIIELLDFIKLYFSVKNKKELGIWKNSPSTQIERTSIHSPFDVALSLKVCRAIASYETYLETVKIKKEKDDLKSADLAFKYLLCKENLTVEEATSMIKNINQKYYYDLKDEKSKLIDIYKSSSIIQKIEEEMKIYRKEEMIMKRKKEKI